MLRDGPALACAKAILDPFIEAGHCGAHVIPTVATIIQNHVKADELAQVIARKESALTLVGGRER